ncbi:MAG: helix-turn-helix domain-containing protein [Alloalcanivorax venustensis]|uniref:GlxA family transcriptional regulator n=1 Tax=Alloalcanivorax venustensis TaxID=172371 RepID=UPI00329A1DAB
MRIGLLLYPGCLSAGLFAVADLLQAANQRQGGRVFDWRWVSAASRAEGDPTMADHGQRLQAEPLGAQPLDVLVVPGAWRDATRVPAPGDAELAGALSRLDTRVRLLAYCTGVCLLAQAGKLDDHPATTTWWLAATIGEHWPRTHWKLNDNVVFGPRHDTAAGVHGYLPLALKLIEDHCGTTVAGDIRAAMVLPRPAPANTPFQTLTALLQRGPLLRRLAQWVEATPASQLTVERLAAHLNLSPRTLARRVKADTGDSAASLMRRIKLNQVSDRLLTTTEPVSQISDRLGFSDDTGLRRQFKKATGLTPGEYRQRFA